MTELPVLKGREPIEFLESIGFRVIRTKGSHIRLKAEEGRVTTVPVHGNKDIPRGLLRKIIGEDLEISLEEFMESYSRFKGNEKID
jgi:predicted RNA binding protein YcfA (HicA-like mRNA interferase family)